MNTTDRILGEAQNVRPPTEKELTHPLSALNYAIRILKGRFPEGEAAIVTYPWQALIYAKDVIGGRWPEAEEVIAKELGKARIMGGDLAKEYLEAFPEAKREWVMRGWLDWFDL